MNIFQPLKGKVCRLYFCRHKYDTIQSHWNQAGAFRFDKKANSEFKKFEDDHGYDSIHLIYFRYLFHGEVKEGTENTKHGVGIELTTTGRFTEGHWEDGKLHGRCRTIYSYGDIEVILMDHGKKHGYRIWHASDGSKEYQEWDNDQCVGKFEKRLSLEELMEGGLE